MYFLNGPHIQSVLSGVVTDTKNIQSPYCSKFKFVFYKLDHLLLILSHKQLDL